MSVTKHANIDTRVSQRVEEITTVQYSRVVPSSNVGVAYTMSCC